MWLSPGKKVCESLINYVIKGIGNQSRVHYLKWVVLIEDCLCCDDPEGMLMASPYDACGAKSLTECHC